MNFRAMSEWHQLLGPVAREDIRRLCETSRQSSDRLLPPGHGAEMDSQIAVAMTRFTRCPEPFALVRLSDCELGMLGAGFLPSDRLGTFAWQSFRAGYGMSDLPLRAKYIDALERSEMVGLQQNWKPAREDTAALLSMLGISLPMPNAVEVHLPYALLTSGTLFSWLSGRKVLLIGHYARRLAEAWVSEAFRAAYSSIGAGKPVDIVGAVPTPARGAGGACSAYQNVLEGVMSFSFDVALCACGMLGKILAWDVRQSGRTAIDVGFVFNALLGDPERSRRPILRDFAWPASQTWDPSP